MGCGSTSTVWCIAAAVHRPRCCISSTKEFCVVKDNLFPVPPVFHLIQKNSGTPWAEMYKVFNMGHRMEIYTDQATADAIIDVSKSFGVAAQVIGHVEVADPGGKKLVIRSEHGTFTY